MPDSSFLKGVTLIMSTCVYATSFLWYLLNLFFKGKSTSITTSITYPLSSQNLCMNPRVELLCMEQMEPLQIPMANSRNFMSMPSSLVPKGGFITTKSTVLGLSLSLATLALMRSKAPPSTFSYSWSRATYTYFWSSSTPMAQAAPMKTSPQMSMPVPTPRSATSMFSIGSVWQMRKRSLAAISGGVMCCSRPIFSFSPNWKSCMSCRNCSMCFCLRRDINYNTLQYSPDSLPFVQTNRLMPQPSLHSQLVLDYFRDWCHTSIKQSPNQMSSFSSGCYQDRIELCITSWVLQSGGDLYEYNSAGYNQRQQYRGVKFELPLPANFVYYFFHLIKKKIKEDRYEYYLERRGQLTSDLSQIPEGVSLFKLMGGVKLERVYQGKKNFISAEAIPATLIKRVQIVGKYEELEMAKPYMVVRTFKRGLRLRPGQLLRFGKVQFIVEEINTKLIREVDYGDDDQQVLNLDNNKDSYIPGTTEKQAEEGSRMSQLGRQCRVCLTSQEEQNDMLVAVCTCSGTGRYIHLECLKKWIQHKLNKMRDSDGSFYQTSLLFCQICKSKFPKAIIKNGKTYGLLKFLEESTPYIALAGRDKLQSDAKFYVAFQETDCVKVGRLADNGVVLEEQSVSRRHASLEHQGEEIIVKDDGSKYGTLVHDQKMRFRVGYKLRAFQIGNIVFSFKVAESRNY